MQGVRPVGLSAAVAALDENLELAAHEGLVELPLDLGLEVEEAGQARRRRPPPALPFAPPPGRGGSRPGRVPEAEEAPEPDVADELESPGEVLLGLARETRR